MEEDEGEEKGGGCWCAAAWERTGGREGGREGGGG